MKKFLASLLSLTMLSSSVLILCSADENGGNITDSESVINLEKNATDSEPVNNLEKNATYSESVNNLEKNATDSEPVNNLEQNTTDSKNINESPKMNLIAICVKFLNDFCKNSASFCAAHQKGIVITGAITAVVAIVGTTAYVFRNKIKKFARKTANTVKQNFNIA